MKTTLALIALLIASAAEAAPTHYFDFACVAENAPLYSGLKIDAAVVGHLDLYANGRKVLDDYKIIYEIRQDGHVWSELKTPRHFEKVANDPNYRPNRYKGFQRLNLSKLIPMGQANFLIPTNLNPNKSDEFYAYFILTNIEDHTGGTVFMKCSID